MNNRVLSELVGVDLAWVSIVHTQHSWLYNKNQVLHEARQLGAHRWKVLEQTNQ